MNEITTVCNTLVYKRYDLPEKFKKETSAIKLLSKIIPGEIPSILVSCEKNLNIMLYVPGVSGLEIKNTTAATKAVTNVIYNIYTKYNLLAYKSSPCWAASIKTLKELLIYYKEFFITFGYTNCFDKIITKIEQVQNCARNKVTNKLTYVHRDIHLGNIIVGNGEAVTLIDFEHAMEAPIELEFQNSLFWRDAYSLDVNLAKHLLRQRGVPYSDIMESLLQNYYVADQVILALKESNANKAQTILDIYANHND